MEYKGLLPIGSVVTLKAAEDKDVMILGYCAEKTDESKMLFDYCGCLHPIGMLSRESTLLFNHDQIQRIWASDTSATLPMPCCPEWKRFWRNCGRKREQWRLRKNNMKLSRQCEEDRAMKCSWKRCCVLLVVMCFLGFAIPATGAEFQFNSQPLEDGTVEIISINETIPNEERQYMEIPSEMDGAAVTKIGEGAFRSSYITGIGFPETIRQLGNQAFAHCHNLTEIVLPDSIETCGEYAFSGCYELETAVLSNGMTIIPKGMFEKCEKLVRVELPSAVTEIQAEAFSSCRNLSSVFIPSTVTFIDDKAFQYCNGLIATVNKGSYAESRCRELGIPLAEDVFSYQLLEDGTAEITGYSGNSVHVFVPGTIDGYPVTSVHFDSGRNERMQDIHFAEGIQRIRGIMDYSDYLETVDLPESLTEIGYNAFYACAELKSIRFPAGLKSIGNSAFKNCNKIKTIILPEGVTSVGEKAFAFMYALEEITLPASLTEIGEDAFEPDSYEKKITVYVQPGSYAEQYCSALDYVNLQ